MRPIKFRGKRVDNREWVYGYYKKSVLPANGVCHFIQFRSHIAEVEPATVGQYTGRPDEDGAEIWEGDVVEIRFHDGRWRRGAVVWFEHHTHFSIDVTVASDGQLGSHSVSMGGSAVAGRFVIGNIHQHPQLLETPND